MVNAYLALHPTKSKPTTPKKMPQPLPGVHPSPNLHDAPDLYEIGQHALDPEQKVEAHLTHIRPWTNAILLDIGAGSGFHLPRYSASANHVYAVEPHAPTHTLARDRITQLGLTNVTLDTGSSEQLPLPDNSIDISIARYAYFWGPGCEKGLLEVERVLKPGGHFFIIDHDRRNGQFASWLNRLPYYPNGHDIVENFWRDQGFAQERIMSEWRFENRADFEAVMRNELPTDLVEQVLKEHTDTTVEYGFSVYRKQF